MVRSAVGAGGRFGAMHSQSPGTWFQGIPGLKVVAPVLAGRRQGAAQGRDPRRQPGRSSSSTSGSTRSRARDARARRRVPLGEAAIAREGGDLTIVSIAQGRPRRAAGGRQLAGDGLDAEVVDLRSLRPLDIDTVLASVAKTNRMLAVEEGPRTGGWATGLLGAVAERGLHDLDDAWVVATDETPIPYSPPLEDAFLPSAETIVESVRARLGTGVETRA